MEDSRFSNPCERVRSSCREWMENESSWDEGCVGKRSVKIQRENMRRLEDDILARKKERKSWIEWDEENWHYRASHFKGSESQKRERIALYIMALDAINFCFWPSRLGESNINELEYDTLAVALRHAAEIDENDKVQSSGVETIVRSSEKYAFSPINLANMTPEKISSLLEPYLNGYYLDNIEERSQLWKEVGLVLIEHFGGSMTELLQKSNKDASHLVEIIFKYFPGFRDEVQLDNKRITFLKRAQIFVGDINSALNLNLNGMERLTTFADYRVPQLLRHYDVLLYSDHLVKLVDSGSDIESGSADEVSIRAATVTAVEDLVVSLNHREQDETFTAVAVDWFLWQVGERMNQEGLLKPFHKVRTTYY